MKRFIVMVAISALALVACGDSDKTDENPGEGVPSASNISPMPSVSPLQTPAGVTVLSPKDGVTGTVDTALAPCDAKKKPGDCWLPLYPKPEMIGDPINLSRGVDGLCPGSDELQCAPQPHDKVIVVCKVVGPLLRNNENQHSRVWYGIHMPVDWQLWGPPTKDLVGFASSLWVYLPAGSKLKKCPQ